MNKNYLFIAKFVEDINDIDIGEKIGDHIYKATYKKPRRNRTILQVVIKIFETTKEPKLFQIFMNEFKMQHDLSHPAILPLLNCSVPIFNQKDYAVISEYMPNGTLSKLIEESNKDNLPYDWETIRAINILGIAAGMAYSHQNDIIHKHLDTSHILLDSNYYPKITSFLFSIQENYEYFFHGEGPMIEMRRKECTDYYAPENFECDKAITEKVDVFSYAFILYKLFERKEDKKPLFLPRIIRGERPSFFNCDISDKYIELIEKCWDQDPEKRPSFDEIVKDFIDNKNDYFDFSLIDEEAFDNYIELLNLEES